MQKLTDYKSEKFNYDFSQVGFYSHEIQNQKCSREQEIRNEVIMFYHVDNCLSDLSSMYDAILEEVKNWLEEKGHKFNKEKNKKIIKELESENKNLANYINKIYREEIKIIKDVRNIITHQKLPRMISESELTLGNLQTFEIPLKSEEYSKTIGFFKDIPSYHNNLKELKNYIRSELNIPDSEPIIPDRTFRAKIEL